MKSLSSAMAFALLCGCTRESQFYHPTMEADPPEIGAEAQAYQDRLANAYVRSPSDNPFCQYTLPGYQARNDDTYGRYKEKYGYDPEKLFRCYQLKDNPTKDEVRGFAQAGFTLSDLYCRTFFRRLALHSNVRRYSHSVVNSAGTLASAIMGLASAGSAATAAVGTAFGAADSAFTNYDATFLVEPDPSLLQRDVESHQTDVENAFDKDWNDPKKKLTYYDANKYIELHASYCTFYGMKAIINATLKENTKPSAGSKTDEKPKIDVKAIEASAREYADSLTDKNAKAAAKSKLFDLSAALTAYADSDKNDGKANAAIDALSKELDAYSKSKSADEAKKVDKQVDATLAALKAANG